MDASEGSGYRARFEDPTLSPLGPSSRTPALAATLGAAPKKGGTLTHTSLLIVQRNLLAARSFQRYLGKHFGVARIACSRQEAEDILATGAPVTHLVCGDDLGEGEPSGRELVQRWRRIRPEISRAILATAVELEPKNATKWGIDAVFFKPTEPAKLLKFLDVF